MVSKALRRAKKRTRASAARATSPTPLESSQTIAVKPALRPSLSTLSTTSSLTLPPSPQLPPPQASRPLITYGSQASRPASQPLTESLLEALPQHRKRGAVDDSPESSDDELSAHNSDPTCPTELQTTNNNSIEARQQDDNMQDNDDVIIVKRRHGKDWTVDYRWVDWTRIPGYRRVADPEDFQLLTSWIWTSGAGVPIEPVEIEQHEKREWLCKECFLHSRRPKIVKYMAYDGITNARNHCFKFHPLDGYEPLDPMDRLKKVGVDPSNPEHAEIAENLLCSPAGAGAALRRWMVKHHIVYQRIGDEAFHEFCTAMNSQFKVPSASTLRKDIIWDFKVHRDKIREELKTT